MSGEPVGVALDRRAFLKNGTSLVFALGASGGLTLLPMRRATAQTVDAAARAIGPTSLDTWLSLDATGAVTAFFGKIDMGQGVDTAIAQVVAEERSEERRVGKECSYRWWPYH